MAGENLSAVLEGGPDLEEVARARFLLELNFLWQEGFIVLLDYNYPIMIDRGVFLLVTQVPSIFWFVFTWCLILLHFRFSLLLRDNRLLVLLLLLHRNLLLSIYLRGTLWLFAFITLDIIFLVDDLLFLEIGLKFSVDFGELSLRKKKSQG